MAALRVMVRADSSAGIGTGHVVRCLTLAHALRARGARVHFVCREHPGNIASRITAEGFGLTLLPPGEGVRNDDPADPYASWLGCDGAQDAGQTGQAVQAVFPGGCDLLVVDHYAIDARWERELQGVSRRIFVIDDLANRVHACQGLLDQNFYPEAEQRYQGLLPATARRFIGPSYALLRDDVRHARGMVPPDGPPWRVLAFFGGTDPARMLPLAVEVARLLEDLPVVFECVGPLEESEAARLPGHASWHAGLPDFAARLSMSHLALGAAGAVSLERVYLRVPALVVICADNQRETAAFLEVLGVVRVVGDASGMMAIRLAEAVRDLLARPDEMDRMRLRAKMLDVGGRVNELYEFLEQRDAAPAG